MGDSRSLISRIFAFIFVCIFSILIFIVFGILLFRNMLSYHTVYKYVSDAKVFDLKSSEISPKDSSQTLRKTIQKEFNSNNISYDVTDDILNSDEINIVLATYIYDYYKYIFYDNEKVEFPTDQLVSIIEQKYMVKMGKSLSEEQKVKLIQQSIVFGNKMDRSLFSNLEINEVVNLNKVKVVTGIINSNYVLVVVIFLIVLMVVFVSRNMMKIHLELNCLVKLWRH